MFDGTCFVTGPVTRNMNITVNLISTQFYHFTSHDNGQIVKILYLFILYSYSLQFYLMM